MTPILRAGRFDARRILTNRTFWITVGVLVVLQPLMARVEGSQIAEIGSTATPATHSELAEALPFMGFDVMPFGEAVMMVWGAQPAAR